MHELWQQQFEWHEPLLPILIGHALARNCSQPGGSNYSYLSQILLSKFGRSANYSPVTCLWICQTQSPWSCLLYYQRQLVLSRHDQIKSRPTEEINLTTGRANGYSNWSRFGQFHLQHRYPDLKVHLRTDSEIVLHWLFSSKPLKQFVANRAKEIKEMFSMSQYWNHCSTTANSVDLLTRRINAHQLRTSPLWNCGPQCRASDRNPMAQVETHASPSAERLLIT